jgi:pyruvate,water dikinase
VELTAMTIPLSPTYTFAFDSTDEPTIEQLGGKCNSLAIMTSAGMPVPPGFAITTDAFDTVIGETGLGERIAEILAGLDVHDVAELDRRSAHVRELILTQEIPPAVRDEVVTAYRALMARCGGEVAVAVRSSATAEDLPDASFAGQQDTYLWIVGESAVMHSVRECWASLYTARAIAYRLSNRIPDEGLSMAVAVQKMVNSRSSGVAMTLDPGTGDRTKIVVESSWGLGEMVVSGEVTPDNFLLDKVMMSVVTRSISDKAEELVPNGRGGIVRREVDEDRREAPSLSDEELLSVARLAKAAERHYGKPQDIEWAIDADLPDGDNILLLQARPETIWSPKSHTNTITVTSQGSGIAAIAKSMLSSLGIH